MRYLIINYLKIIYNSIKSFIINKKFFFVFWLLFLLITFITFTTAVYYWFSYIVDNIPWWYIFVPQIIWLIISLVFSVMILSWIIWSLSTLYKNDEIKFLLYTPIKINDIFKYWFLKVYIMSLFWVILFIYPIAIAYWIINKLWFIYYLYSIFLIASTVLFWIFLWLIILLLIFIILNNWKRIIYSFIIWFFLITWYIISKVKSLISIWEWWLETVLEEYIYSINYSNFLLPSNWINNLFFSYWNDTKILISWTIFIIISIYIVYLITNEIWKKYYLKSYNIYEKISSKKFWKKPLINLFGKNKNINLFMKDLLIYIKDPSWWWQLVVLWILILIYMIIISWININQLNSPGQISIITIWNIAMTWFLMSAIALKFIYPNTSIEWKAFWINKTLPINLKNIYIIKIIFYYIFFLIIWLIISNAYSEITWLLYETRKILNIIVSITTLFIVSFYFFLWNIYPNFQETNSSQISTSIPWLIWVIISNLYIFIIAFILYIFFYWYYNETIKCNDISLYHFLNPILLILIITILLSYLMYIYWYKSYKSLSW